VRRHLISVGVLLAVGLLRPALGVVLLTEQQALTEVFPDADSVTVRDVALTAAQVEALKGGLGGKLELYQSGSQSGGVEERTQYRFHFGMKGGYTAGVAVVEVQPGKWGPVTYIVALDAYGSKVVNLAVMSYTEKRGRPISTKRFLGQFTGKTAASPLTVGKDIDAVSGATISSRATAFAVKKVLLLYQTVYGAAGSE
jgi:Na+-translocating ferredoxin:NAD+ oxidoreductase RnfG subunit